MTAGRKTFKNGGEPVRPGFIPKPVESLVNTARPIRRLTFGSVVSMGRLPGHRLREISTAFSIAPFVFQNMNLFDTPFMPPAVEGGVYP